MKKTFLISITVFLITLLFVGVYTFVFRDNTRNAVVDAKKQAESKAETEQLIAESNTVSSVAAVTDVSAYAAALLDDTHIAYFNDRSLKRASLGGGGEETLVGNLPGKIMRAVWSPDRQRVVVLFEIGPGQQRWHLVSLSDRLVTPLKTGISSVSWSNLSERIFYSYTDPKTGKSEIDSAKPDGTDWRLVTPTSYANPFISPIPSSGMISFWNRPSAFEETSFLSVPITGGDPKRIFSGKYGADYLWSPNGSTVLISNTLTKGGTETRLGTANQDGGEFRTIQAPTIVSKAVWSKDSKTIYYALPLSIPENAVLPNDYFARPIHTQDSFWKMDVTTGKSDRIIEPDKIDGGFDSSGLFLDKNEEYLFFTDRSDEKVYRIRIAD